MDFAMLALVFFVGLHTGVLTQYLVQDWFKHNP
jgi:hypothetical protein